MWSGSIIQAMRGMWAQYRPFRKSGKAAIAQHRTPEDVRLWCRENFDGMQAHYHWWRIERRLGRCNLMVRGKFELTPAFGSRKQGSGFWGWWNR